LGVWGPGVFDNDATADFAVAFAKTEPAERIVLLRNAVGDALDPDVEDLEECAGAAIGAAAIVAATLPDGPPVGDDIADEVGELSVPNDLIPLALRAFDHIMANDFEYANMADDPNLAPGLTEVRQALDDHN
jgi:hypothetical protein